ncbi:hypothetical protein [Carnimonas nigrificans]|uniref:hypothetical protein n=1 Tax=Carnimonas nigrificans TaxID=64323 RepID=UPI0012EB5062|nr:hypothetical protein [Carnimonas nigrificans]
MTFLAEMRVMVSPHSRARSAVKGKVKGAITALIYQIIRLRIFDKSFVLVIAHE